MADENHNAPLLREIERFMDKHNMSESGFSRKFTGNPNFVERLRDADYSPLDRTVKAVRKAMRDHETKLTLDRE